LKSDGYGTVLLVLSDPVRGVLQRRCAERGWKPDKGETTGIYLIFLHKEVLFLLVNSDLGEVAFIYDQA